MIEAGRRYALWLNGNRKPRYVAVFRVKQVGESTFFDTAERPGRWLAWKTVDAYEEVGRNERA